MFKLANKQGEQRECHQVSFVLHLLGPKGLTHFLAVHPILAEGFPSGPVQWTKRMPAIQKTMTLDVHYLISGCGSSSNICRSSLFSPKEVGFGCQERDGGSGICSNPPPNTSPPPPNHQSSSCLLCPSADPRLFCLHQPPDRQPGRWRRGERVMAFAVQSLGQGVCVVPVCVCCPVLPLPLTLYQGVFLQIGQKNMYVCV